MVTQYNNNKNDAIKKSLSDTLITILDVPEISADDIYQTIEQPPNHDMGDYALPCFQFAKIFRKNPQEIAKNLKEKIENSNNPWIQNLQVVGAFLNFFINKESLAKYVITKVFDHSFFEKQKSSGKRIMVEYSQPNTHKEFHIGHARNACLGDSLCRILTYSGHKVIPVNYIGDEGTHVAKCLWQIKSCDQKLPDKNKVQWYGKQYTIANQKIKEASEEKKKKINKDISTILANLESQNGEDYKLWQETRKDCLEDFNKLYKWLDVHFEHFFYESEVSESSQKLVKKYIEKGIFKESQGAYGIDLEPYKLGFFMAQKSDGTTLYITKDLALARHKFNDFKIDQSIYVVGSEQKFHFQQLFKALEIIGFKKASQCYHLSYAHVVLPSGKMSSRLGNTFTFQDLIEQTTKDLDSKLDRYKDSWSSSEIKEASHQLAVGAIKYGMLASDPNKEIVYSPEGWISFEGNSGPYLAYSYARSQSIIRKSEIKDIAIPRKFHFEHESEHQLLRYIYDFNNITINSATQHKPSLLCHHLYDMCKCFNKMYSQVKILSSKDKNTKLALLKTFAITLKKGLFLLGITPPEKM